MCQPRMVCGVLLVSIMLAACRSEDEQNSIEKAGYVYAGYIEQTSVIERGAWYYLPGSSVKADDKRTIAIHIDKLSVNVADNAKGKKSPADQSPLYFQATMVLNCSSPGMGSYDLLGGKMTFHTGDFNTETVSVPDLESLQILPNHPQETIKEYLCTS